MEENVPYKFNIINSEKINSQFNFGKFFYLMRYFLSFEIFIPVPCCYCKIILIF